MSQFSVSRFLDRAILPAIILIATKVGGIWIGCLIFNIAWAFNPSPIENNFLIFQFQNIEDLTTVTNFSDTLLVLTSAAFLSWALFQASHLNMDRTHPTVVSNLFRRKKYFWLTTANSIDHETTVWLSLIWLVLFMVLINFYQGLTTSFVLGLSFATTLGLTFVFYQTVRKN